MADKTLDTKGLNCPLPILRTKKSLADMSSGQILKILATDPGSVKDFQAFSKQTGNELLDQAQSDGEFVGRHEASGIVGHAADRNGPRIIAC